MNDLSRLASYLRENGEKILNLGHKLVLTVPMLDSLNESLKLIVENDESRPSSSSSFQVVNTNNSKLEIFHDLAFLHDFLQMTAGLKITSAHLRVNSKEPIVIDITKFKVLKSLELRGVAICSISGLEHFRGQLETLVCIHCLENLDSMLVSCGADESSGVTWSELREANFSYNQLDSLDLSLNYVPWLQILDVSHNRLTNAEAVVCLPNLICLNLNYNLLTSVPALHKCARLKLQTLGIKYNNVEDLSEIVHLEKLTYLDLSCNCLMDHGDLRYLLGLPMITWLNLKGNPLGFHKKHRLLAARCLHTGVDTGKFLLDLMLLSKSECKELGKMSLVRPVQLVDALTPPIRISEATSSRSVAYSPPRTRFGRRGGRVREAVISEHDETAESEPEMNASIISSLEISTEHLQTKKQIELLRERFGEENWLHSSGGSCVQDVLGLPQSHKPLLSSTPRSRTQYQDQANFIHNAILSDLPVQDVEVAAHKEVPSENITALPVVGEMVSNEVEVLVDSVFCSKDMALEVPEGESQVEDDEDEGEKQIYLVEHLNNPGEGIFVVVTKEYIKEKEAGCGRTLEQWALDSLLSVVRVCSVPVTVVLSFRTVRRDRQERSYVMEERDAQELVNTLSDVLASQILSCMKSCCCMKCSTQFSTEVNVMDKSITCPTCQSTYVIEMDEVPLPEKQTNNNVDNPAVILNIDSISSEMNNLSHSPSQSSIGADAPSRLQVTAIIHCSETRGAEQSTTTNARSAASLDPSPEGSSATVPGRSDSDVEVISNPSQSSIEVLDDTRQDLPASTTTSHRSQLMSLMGLTESSSSGSFTDSVCTTYENQSYLPLPKDQVNTNADERLDKTISEEKTEADEIGDISLENLTSILDGVLHNMAMTITPTNSTPQIAEWNTVEEGNKVQYNYLDFLQVDHRVKLHLYHQVFTDRNEELLLLVRAHIVPATSPPYAGCIVISTCTVYLLQVTGLEGDNPDLWLVKREGIPIDKLTTLQALPWRQGISMEFVDKPDMSVLGLLQDIRRTTNLLSFATVVLPEKCKIINTLCAQYGRALQEFLSSVRKTHTQATLLQMTLFSGCKVTDGSGALISSSSFGFLFITDTTLVLSKENTDWMFPNSNSKLEMERIQNMSNLIHVQLNKLNVILEFLNETNSFSSVEIWMVEMKTVDSLQQIISAIRKSWEELFAVPLQVTENADIQEKK